MLIEITIQLLVKLLHFMMFITIFAMISIFYYTNRVKFPHQKSTKNKKCATGSVRTGPFNVVPVWYTF